MGERHWLRTREVMATVVRPKEEDGGNPTCNPLDVVMCSALLQSSRVECILLSLSEVSVLFANPAKIMHEGREKDSCLGCVHSFLT